MLKFTDRGIERMGSLNEISEEDREFINEMFNEFANHEKHPLEKEDKIDD
jgi:hypothetical protein